MSHGKGAVWRPRNAVFACTCVVALMTSCNPHFGQTDAPFQRAVLTGASGESYTYTGDGGTVAVAAAPTNTDKNIREVFWNEDGPYLADEQACITWHTTTGTLGGDIIQPGLALRIAPSGADGASVKAITVNQNIWYAATWLFHVNLWDSSVPGARIAQHAQFDVSPAVGKLFIDDEGNLQSSIEPPPWHVCARLRGPELTVKVWTGDNAEPTWDDPVHVYATVLPESWDYAGYSGGYVGHVEAGQTAVFSGRSSTPLCLQPDMIETAFCQQEFEDLGHPSPLATVASTPATMTREPVPVP